MDMQADVHATVLRVILTSDHASLHVCPASSHLACEQEVLRLQVPVHHAQLMAMVHDLHHLAEDLQLRRKGQQLRKGRIISTIFWSIPVACSGDCCKWRGSNMSDRPLTFAAFFSLKLPASTMLSNSSPPAHSSMAKCTKSLSSWVLCRLAAGAIVIVSCAYASTPPPPVKGKPIIFLSLLDDPIASRLVFVPAHTAPDPLLETHLERHYVWMPGH